MSVGRKISGKRGRRISTTVSRCQLPLSIAKTLIRSEIVNAIIFLVPISAFDQQLAEVRPLSSLFTRTVSSGVRDRDITGLAGEPAGGFVPALEIRDREQAPGAREHRAVSEQVRPVEEEARERRAAPSLHAVVQPAK